MIHFEKKRTINKFYKTACENGTFHMYDSSEIARATSTQKRRISMSQLNTVKSLPTRKFVRKVGTNLPHFLFICHKVAEYEAEERRKWPMKNRGLSSQKLTLQDKVLLTFFYLRHYHTFEQLGPMFGISESYACKVYHRYRDILVKLIRLPSWKGLVAPELEAILLDVTEQPIERPTQKQRQYYSGKKNDIPLKPNSLCV